MLDEDDLAPADQDLLDMLRDGRITAPFGAEKTGYSLQYVRDRLGRLVEHGNARKVYDGLYELVEDPRGEIEGKESGPGLEDFQQAVRDAREAYEDVDGNGVDDAIARLEELTGADDE